MDPGSAPFQIDSALGLSRQGRGPRAEGTGTQLLYLTFSKDLARFL